MLDVWQIYQVLSGAVSPDASSFVHVQSDWGGGEEHDHREHVRVLRAAHDVRHERFCPCPEYVKIPHSRI